MINISLYDYKTKRWRGICEGMIVALVKVGNVIKVINVDTISVIT
jgi:hypothetical protein